MEETAQPQAAFGANQPEQAESMSENTVPHESTESFLTVKYNKEEKELSEDEAKTYAQKGMNYDKLNRKLDEASQKLKEYESRIKTQTSGESRQEIVNKQLSEFIRNNPGIDPSALPKEVIDEWRAGVPLSEAAKRHEVQRYEKQMLELKEQIEQLRTNEQNSAASMGRPSSKGATRQKPLTVEAIKKMSRKEVEKNYDRIWEFLTGVKKKK